MIRKRGNGKINEGERHHGYHLILHCSMVELALELLDAVLETILSGGLLGLGKRRGL